MQALLTARQIQFAKSSTLNHSITQDSRHTRHTHTALDTLATGLGQAAASQVVYQILQSLMLMRQSQQQKDRNHEAFYYKICARLQQDKKRNTYLVFLFHSLSLRLSLSVSSSLYLYLCIFPAFSTFISSRRMRETFSHVSNLTWLDQPQSAWLVCNSFDMWQLRSTVG